MGDCFDLGEETMTDACFFSALGNFKWFSFAFVGELCLLLESVFLPPARLNLECLGLVALGEVFGFRPDFDLADATDLPDSGESTS